MLCNFRTLSRIRNFCSFFRALNYKEKDKIYGVDFISRFNTFLEGSLIFFEEQDLLAYRLQR